MDRRMFLRSALVVAGSATAFAVMGARESKAESLMEQLKNPAEALPPNPADMPAEGAQEAQYWGPGWRGRGWRRRPWRGPRLWLGLAPSRLGPPLLVAQESLGPFGPRLPRLVTLTFN